MAAWKRGWFAADRLIFRIVKSIVFLCTVLMVVVSTMQVLMRYILSMPIKWGNEFCCFMLVYDVFLGAALGLREAGHVRLEIEKMNLPKPVMTLFHLISDVAVYIFLLIYLVYGYQFAKGKKLVVPKFWKYALAFNIPLIPHYLSEMILTQSDRIMISNLESDAATANYTIAYSIVLIMQLVMSAISASYLPWSYEQLKKNNYEALKKMGNILLILISGCIFLLMMFVPEIIFLFAGNKYADAVYCIPPIALSIFFMFLYDLFSTVEFFYAKNMIF